jgi:ribosome maturation factor RimP
MSLDDLVVGIVRKAIESTTYEVIDVKIDGRRHVRAWIDKEPDGVSVQSCAEVSRTVKHALQEQGIDAGAFHVEVQSPGLDRLLTRDKDFVRFAGSIVVVHLLQKRGDRRKYKGKLIGLRDGKVVVHDESTMDEVSIGRDEIAEARLVPVFPEHKKHAEHKKH